MVLGRIIRGGTRPATAAAIERLECKIDEFDRAERERQRRQEESADRVRRAEERAADFSQQRLRNSS